MRFEHTFDIAAPPADLIEKFDDVPLIASFLPGAGVGAPRDDGSYPGTLTVAFGPKRITFQGNLKNEVNKPELRGVMSGAANADVRGARMAVTLDYALSEVEGATPAATRVSLVSQAQLTGVLAQFAKTGGTVLAHAILDEFAQRFSAHCAGASVDAGSGAASGPPGTAAQPAAGPDGPPALSVGLIAAGVFRQWMRRLGAWFKRVP